MISLRRELCLAQPVGFETEEDLQSQTYGEGGQGRKSRARGRNQNEINGGPDQESHPEPVPRQPKGAKKERFPVKSLAHEGRLGKGFESAAAQMNRIEGHGEAPF